MRAIYLIALLVAAGLSLLYLGQASDLAATSYDVAALQHEKSVWDMRNQQLRLQIAELESLDRVDKVAASRMHMGPPAHVVYVKAPAETIVIATPSPSSTPTASKLSPSTLSALLDGSRSGEGIRVGH